MWTGSASFRRVPLTHWGYTRMLHTTHRGWSVWLAAALLATLLVATGPPAHADHDFEDVPQGHRFHDAISWLAAEGATQGYDNGRIYKPGETMTRQAIASFLYNLAGAPPGPFSSEFDDVPSHHRFHTQISWFAEQDLTDGYANPDGTVSFRPGTEVTRQAAASFLYKAAGEPDGAFSHAFTDIPPGHRFEEAIAWMADEEISVGYADDTFRPTKSVTRQAAASFLYEMSHAGYGVGPGGGGDSAPADVCTDADSGGHVNDLTAASDVTTEQADVDGDGQPDDVTTYRLSDEWWVRFATAAGYTVERTFQVTGSMAPVRPYGHGWIGVERDAVFLVESTSASGENLLVMGLWEDDDGRPCVPAPIDAEHNATFPVHGSMGAPTGVACRDQTGDGRQELVVTQASQRQDGGYDWDSAIWRWNGQAYSTVQGSALEYLGAESGTADSLEQLSGEGRVGFQCESYG